MQCQQFHERVYITSWCHVICKHRNCHEYTIMECHHIVQHTLITLKVFMVSCDTNLSTFFTCTHCLITSLGSKASTKLSMACIYHTIGMESLVEPGNEANKLLGCLVVRVSLPC